MEKIPARIALGNTRIRGKAVDRLNPGGNHAFWRWLCDVFAGDLSYNPEQLVGARIINGFTAFFGSTAAGCAFWRFWGLAHLAGDLGFEPYTA